MKRKAIAEATIRLERARAAVSDMETAVDRSFADFETAWWRFILAAAGLYSKLEQGAKGNGKSKAWSGRVKHTRRKDPLLSYLHHARNSEYHALEGSTSKVGITATPARKGVRVINPTKEGETAQVFVDIPSKAGALVKLHPPGIRLVEVRNERCKDTFPVPTHHLGQELVDQMPLTVAKAGLGYLEGLVAEAATLPE
ncbi:MAG TPA: hypothetical protein VEX11_11475 [Acetobacteraceae bacterium]|nr:hypothetical protein [Acetobacteraceae bacterium]